MILSLILTITANATSLKPTTLKELRSISVKITNAEETSGGTGSILKSHKNASYILTNKHVCGVVENGGFVKDTENNKYKVIAYKTSFEHDLCVVTIKQNLGISLTIASQLPKPADVSIVSGHPRLLPNVITVGHFSDTQEITVMTGVRECTDKEVEEDALSCAFFGYPIVTKYNSQLVSNLIQPGNSGSAVFNSSGEIAGVIFAGSGDLGFGWIVPLLYVSHFVHNLNNQEWIYPKENKVLPAKNLKKKTVTEFCKTTNKYLCKVPMSK
jgi:S1-C subfamily serine protease